MKKLGIFFLVVLSIIIFSNSFIYADMIELPPSFEIIYEIIREESEKLGISDSELDSILSNEARAAGMDFDEYIYYKYNIDAEELDKPYYRKQKNRNIFNIIVNPLGFSHHNNYEIIWYLSNCFEYIFYFFLQSYPIILLLTFLFRNSKEWYSGKKKKVLSIIQNIFVFTISIGVYCFCMSNIYYYLNFEIFSTPVFTILLIAIIFLYFFLFFYFIKIKKKKQWYLILLYIIYTILIIFQPSTHNAPYLESICNSILFLLKMYGIDLIIAIPMCLVIKYIRDKKGRKI